MCIRDSVEALWMLGRVGAPTGTWNVASGRSVTIRDLADIVERGFGRQLGRESAERRPGDVTNSAVSAASLRRLGWRPSIGLSSGVEELVRSASNARRSV